MMYKKNLVAAIKAGGKVLRETTDRVYLPFGSEYTILLKNLSTARAQARITIDGQDTMDGRWLVIEPNGQIEIERFLRNDNYLSGNRFKFIERTQAVEEARGVKIDDGLVRVEYKFEKIFQPSLNVTNVWPWLYRPYVPPVYPNPWITYTTCSGALQQAQSSPQQSSNVVRCASMNAVSAPQNEAGITVPGSHSNQKFSNAGWFATEAESHVIVLHLVGGQGNQKVIEAVTTQKKPVCTTCRKTNKAVAKFCSRCGTSLILL